MHKILHSLLERRVFAFPPKKKFDYQADQVEQLVDSRHHSRVAGALYLVVAAVNRGTAPANSALLYAGGGQCRPSHRSQQTCEPPPHRAASMLTVLPLPLIAGEFAPAMC